MRNTPHTCQICGQVEQPVYDPEFDESYYLDEDDLREEDLHWVYHRYDFPPLCTLVIVACEECSKMGSVEIFDRFRERVRAGDIAWYH